MKIVLENLRNVLIADLRKHLELFNPKATCNIVFDLNDGEYHLCNRGKCAKNQLLILSLKITNYKTDATKIKEAIRVDAKSSLICHSTFVKEYKLLVGKIKPLLEVENPHYKRASFMKLYDTRMLKYKLNQNEHNNKK